uniref:ATP synthase complex subunit 8 n=1 Tax=Canthesancus helluo TaxID=2126071 RepID=A0A343W933_9HEMI|nr:ATP synthase F0 subunit 8 [Canthesancus helluo]AVZ00873.1 ATP synthase F0 subunit 8 [Canthesancus helluo]
MPQMAPIWWTLLFIMFILSFTFIYKMIYYQFTTEPSTQSKNLFKTENINWKW